MMGIVRLAPGISSIFYQIYVSNGLALGTAYGMHSVRTTTPLIDCFVRSFEPHPVVPTAG